MEEILLFLNELSGILELNFDCIIEINQISKSINWYNCISDLIINNRITL